jgi:hypothetical protein
MGQSRIIEADSIDLNSKTKRLNSWLPIEPLNNRVALQALHISGHPKKMNMDRNMMKYDKKFDKIRSSARAPVGKP